MGKLGQVDNERTENLGRTPFQMAIRKKPRLVGRPRMSIRVLLPGRSMQICTSDATSTRLASASHHTRTNQNAYSMPMRSLDRPRYPRPRAPKYVPVALEIGPIYNGGIRSAQVVIPNLMMTSALVIVTSTRQNARECGQS